MKTSSRNPNHAPWSPSETRKKVGLDPTELRVMLAIISYERVFGHSPTRAAIIKFLGLTPHGYRLMQIGWIESKRVGPIELERPRVRSSEPRSVWFAVWASTALARQALGFEDAEERRTA
jgi:hypothetical protein